MVRVERVGHVPRGTWEWELVLGSPLFDRAVVSPPKGLPPPCRPQGNRPPYIDQATWTDLDGHVSEEAHRSFVTTQQLRSGGTLDLAMSGTPGNRFGIDPENRPTSRWASPDFVAVPGIEAPRTFQAQGVSFQLQHIQPDAVLSYSINDGATWDIYDGPVAVQETTHILARATLDDLTSNTVEHTMLKVDHGWHLTLEHAPDNQYLAGGDQALIDGLEGGHDFRTGEWQGFWESPWWRASIWGASATCKASRCMPCKTSSPGFGPQLTSSSLRRKTAWISTSKVGST